MKYIKRDIENHFKKEADFYPIIAVIGARQVGKTTLIRNCFSHKQYINFEDPAIRDFFNTDPVSFIDKYKDVQSFRIFSKSVEIHWNYPDEEARENAQRRTFGVQDYTIKPGNPNGY